MATSVTQATPELLRALAMQMGHDPLFVRYKLNADSLAHGWLAALERGDGIRVALTAAGPVGLAWFVPKGAFCRGAYLRLLAVSQGGQGQGVGKQLLGAYEAACAPALSGWFLLCSEDNAAAQRFYRAQGYSQVGLLPAFVLPDVAEAIFYKPPKPLAP